MAKKLLIIDSSSLIYRAYYGINKTGKSNTPINAIYGFYTMLSALIADFQPDYMVVTYDRPRSELIRTRIFPEYKANRAAMPDELATQIPIIKNLVRSMGIFSIEEAGYEADDIIATVALNFTSPDVEGIIATGDKDLMQSVNENVYHWDISKKKMSGSTEVIEHFGVTPHRVPDVLALSGDTSDNIPGVPGIGLKTAKRLIGEYGCLETLYENIDGISGKKRKENLIKNKEQAFLSRQLTSVNTTPPIGYSLDDMIIKAPDLESLVPILTLIGLESVALSYTEPPPNIVEIYSDGSALKDYRGGYGTILRFGPHEKEISGFEPQTTSQRMELTGAIKGLQALKVSKTVHLISDSQYLVKGMNEWLSSWARSGRLSGEQAVKNSDLWQELLRLKKIHKVNCTWVKGHAGHPFNERCDKLARQAINDAEKCLKRSSQSNSLTSKARKARSFTAGMDSADGYAVIGCDVF